jgi:hypothetical protein
VDHPSRPDLHNRTHPVPDLGALSANQTELAKLRSWHRVWQEGGTEVLSSKGPVRVRGAGGGRVSIAGLACYRPGDRPHLYYHLLVYRRRKDEAATSRRVVYEMTTSRSVSI